MANIVKILVTGSYQPSYNRNAIILSGLRDEGHVVIEYPLTRPYNVSRRKLLPELSKKDYYDFVYLPSFTHRDVCWVKRNTNIPILFDPLISKHLTAIYDYRNHSKFSLRSITSYYRDYTSLRCADKIIADTRAHADYYRTQYGIPAKKIDVVPIGANCNFIQSLITQETATNPGGRLTIGFYGGFNPLQGTTNIIHALNLLRDHEFRFIMVGDGFDFSAVKGLIEKYQLKIELPGRVSLEELYTYISSFDICLGVFGETKKVDLVIPNKIYDYSALGKPIITKRTTAIDEIFKHGENIFLTSNTPESIAEAILTLSNDPDQRRRLGDNAQKLVCETYNHKHIAKILLNVAP